MIKKKNLFAAHYDRIRIDKCLHMVLLASFLSRYFSFQMKLSVPDGTFSYWNIIITSSQTLCFIRNVILSRKSDCLHVYIKKNKTVDQTGRAFFKKPVCTRHLLPLNDMLNRGEWQSKRPTLSSCCEGWEAPTGQKQGHSNLLAWQTVNLHRGKEKKNA